MRRTHFVVVVSLSVAWNNEEEETRGHKDGRLILDLEHQARVRAAVHDWKLPTAYSPEPIGSGPSRRTNAASSSSTPVRSAISYLDLIWDHQPGNHRTVRRRAHDFVSIAHPATQPAPRPGTRSGRPSATAARVASTLLATQVRSDGGAKAQDGKQTETRDDEEGEYRMWIWMFYLVKATLAITWVRTPSATLTVSDTYRVDRRVRLRRRELDEARPRPSASGACLIVSSCCTGVRRLCGLYISSSTSQTGSGINIQHGVQLLASGAPGACRHWRIDPPLDVCGQLSLTAVGALRLCSGMTLAWQKLATNTTVLADTARGKSVWGGWKLLRARAFMLQWKSSLVLIHLAPDSYAAQRGATRPRIYGPPAYAVNRKSVHPGPSRSTGANGVGALEIVDLLSHLRPRAFTSVPPVLRKALASLAAAAVSFEREHEWTNEVAEFNFGTPLDTSVLLHLRWMFASVLSSWAGVFPTGQRQSAPTFSLLSLSSYICYPLPHCAARKGRARRLFHPGPVPQCLLSMASCIDMPHGSSRPLRVRSACSIPLVTEGRCRETGRRRMGRSMDDVDVDMLRLLYPHQGVSQASSAWTSSSTIAATSQVRS
ncbi:hypothetical protein K438DRAFT_1946115 [Mycena galopus ATCC 62051]|nr:hypothetical protein K438DRAFT_1946115 [Mycena galopus ATCC 62051]